MIGDMEVIDGTWILARLPRHHGAKGELADAIGLPRDKLAKVLQGKRRLTPEEISRVVRHFERAPSIGATPGGSSQGFSDEAEPFHAQAFPPASRSPVQAIFGRDATTPEITHRARVALPDLAICPGDQIVCDLAREARTGELVIVAMADLETGETTAHLIRRYLPPFLSGGACGIAAPVLRETDPGVFVRYPVIGILRTEVQKE